MFFLRNSSLIFVLNEKMWTLIFLNPWLSACIQQMNQSIMTMCNLMLIFFLPAKYLFSDQA